MEKRKVGREYDKDKRVKCKAEKCCQNEERNDVSERLLEGYTREIALMKVRL